GGPAGRGHASPDAPSISKRGRGEADTPSGRGPEHSRKDRTLVDVRGKSQQGWLIYVPLIESLIGAEPGSVDTPDFAAAVARWQTGNQLPPNGVIDDQTLNLMIRSWQSHRLYKSDFPNPDQLVLGTPDDFYDPTRADELRMVERQTFDAYKR